MNEAFNDELITTSPCRIVGSGKPRTKGAAWALSVYEIESNLDAVEDYNRAFRLRIPDVLGDIPVALLTPAKVRSWHEGLPDTPTLNGKSYDLLKHLMNDAVNDELVATNPCRIVGAGKPRAKGAAEALSAHEVGPYLDAVEEYYRPALAVAVLGGSPIW